jgi:hypothetical protein
MSRISGVSEPLMRVRASHRAFIMCSVLSYEHSAGAVCEERAFAAAGTGACDKPGASSYQQGDHVKQRSDVIAEPEHQRGRVNMTQASESQTVAIDISLFYNKARGIIRALLCGEKS